MRIAIVHDYIKEYGGAERVLEALHEIWPTSPVYTTVYLPEFLGPHKERFKNWDIRTSFLQYIPFKEKLISPFRIIAPFVFKTFDFSQFDVVIVSATGAYSPNGIKIKNQKSKVKNAVHICYSHTPPRYLYGYATARNWNKSIILGSIGKMFNHFLRLVDFRSAQNVDYFIANSKNVAERIKKFYRKDSIIIYPPVDIRFALRSLRQFGDSSNRILKQPSSLALANGSKHGSRDSLFKSAPHAEAPRANSYFLAGGRLARPKHIDLIVQACEELKVPLKIFGRSFGDAPNPSADGSQYPNIQFLGEVSDGEKLELMRHAKAYIFASEDEDFGITPVEAMSIGTPVIAYRSGGVVESIIDDKTGIFYRFNDLNHLSEAVNKFEKMKFDKEAIMKHAQKFSKERFKKEIKKFVEKIYASKEK